MLLYVNKVVVEFKQITLKKHEVDNLIYIIRVIGIPS